MKWFKTNDVIEGLLRHGFDELKQTSGNVILYHHESESMAAFPLSMEELPENLLTHLLPKAHLDPDTFLKSLEFREVAQTVTKDFAAVADASIGVQSILEQPQGTPVDLSSLSQEELSALARDSRGMWKDNPMVEDSVVWVRELREGAYRIVPEE